MADENRVTALQYARVIGSVCITVVALIAVDMPGGYAGPANTFSFEAQLFSGLTVAAAIAAMAALYQDKRWAGAVALSVYSLNAAVMLPAFADSPIVSGAAVAWNLGIILREVFELSARDPTGFRPFFKPPPRVESGWHRRSIIHIGILAALMSVGVAGYEFTDNAFVLTICLALHLGFVGAVAFSHREEDETRIHHWIRAVVIVAPALAAPFFDVIVIVIVYSLVTAGHLFEHAVTGRIYEELLDSFYDNPSVLIVSAFVTLITIGTVLLTFPVASAAGPVSPIDAVFTATSATCVTGLIVLDTAADFSLFGQVVILGLFQIGGLGIMTLSTFAVLLIGARLRLRGERALGEVLDIRDPSASYRLVRFIVASTLVIEAIGAAFLTWRFHETMGLGWQEASWKGVFHAVSSFCNAGFALQSDSFVSMQSDPIALTTSMILITLGGLGFPCLVTLWDVMRRKEPNHSLRLHTRVVLVASSGLLLLGFLVYLFVEWDATLGTLSTPDKVMNALFQSVTLRTSGFNTVSFDSLQPATFLMMIVMMFIGASPGSTGGGIKTTTFAFLGLAVATVIRGDRRVVLGGRELDERGVYRATGILFLATIFVFVGLFALLVVEEQPFMHLLFEAVSAFGTVGLSLGATPALTAFGKLVIVLLMFVGRIGPVTIALLLGQRRSDGIRYPRTSIMVG